MMFRLFLSAVLCVSVSIVHGQSSFEINSNNTTPEIDEAIIYATEIWSTYLNSEIPIKLNVNYSNLTGFGPLAFCIGNGERNFTNAPLNDVWYPTCLANSIALTELNPGEFDIDVVVNSFVDYDFGTDGDPGPGQFDFVSVFMHEIVHGLGGLSITDVEDGEGSIGMVTEESIFPITTSWSFPDFEGQPSIWDTFLVNGDEQHLTDADLFPNPSPALGDEITSNDVWFSGPLATAVNNGDHPKIYAPSTFAFGSSIHHFDEASFPNSSGNGLFTPFASAGEVNHEPGPLLLAALADIGWSINSEVDILNIAKTEINLYPNPATQIVNISLGNDRSELTMYSVHGERIPINLKAGANSISQLPSGIYLIKIQDDDKSDNRKLIIQ